MARRDDGVRLGRGWRSSIFLALLAATLAWPADGHPGRQDRSGCHRCRTHCADWGLKSGEYHCHDGTQWQGARPAPPPPPGRTLPRRDPGAATRDAEKPDERPTLAVDLVSVVDGDTVVARDGVTFYLLRLRDIDAPEIGQPFADGARDWLARQVEGRRLRVEPGPAQGCVIPVAIPQTDGSSLAEAQLRLGLAWAAPGAPEAWRQLEARARSGGVGLWSGEAPEAPWRWRADAVSRRQSELD